jgi:hypothetical protein
MDASNASRRQLAARSAPRRPGCSTPRSTRKAERRSAQGLTVTIRAIPLPDPQTNPLRARQLAVIVDLLRSAAAEAAARRDTASGGESGDSGK